MATETELVTQIAEVDSAISALVSGGVQGYTTRTGQGVTRLSLKELREHRAELQRQLNRVRRRGDFGLARRGRL